MTDLYLGFGSELNSTALQVRALANNICDKYCEAMNEETRNMTYWAAAASRLLDLTHINHGNNRVCNSLDHDIDGKVTAKQIKIPSHRQ